MIKRYAEMFNPSNLLFVIIVCEYAGSTIIKESFQTDPSLRRCKGWGMYNSRITNFED